MNIKLLLRIYAGLMAFFTLGALFSAESMMESFGMDYTSESGIMLQFAILGQILFLVLTFQLPDWLGENLAKAGCTYAVLCLLPVGLNSYHALNDILPVGPAFFVENTIWVAFAVLFYLYSKK